MPGVFKTIMKTICHIISVIAMTMATVNVHASSIDSLLNVLDRDIANKPKYESIKRERIDKLQAAANIAGDDITLFKCKRQLFLEYRSFSMDAALDLARECRRIASRVQCDTIIWLGILMEVEALKGFGLYDRSLALLDSLPAEARKHYRTSVLNRYCSIYYSMSERAFPSFETEKALKFLIAYRDSIIAETPQVNQQRLINEAEIYRLSGHPDMALKAIDSISSLPGAEQFDNISTINYLKAQSLLLTGDKEQAKEYFARSAILDIRDCNRKYEALQELAKLINDDGDSERAYTYIMCSLNDIQHSNARSRLLKITEYLPIISSAYAANSASKTRYKNMLMTCISILSLLLLLSCAFLYRSKLMIGKDRINLAKKNEQLTSLKDQLSSANERLVESAKVKEEYIGYLFNLCSEYIDSHQRERAVLFRKLKTGNVSDVEKALDQPFKGTDYLKSFFDMFDSIFLSLFPDFIEKFNSLLHPDFQLYPREGELLSPELRIYALVRLGINDSTRIANFLHYSPQTVYNYRFKIRSHAIVPKTQFADRVRSL